MQHLLRYTLRVGAALMLLAALAFTAGTGSRVTATPRAAPAAAPITGTSCATACDLYATTGSITMPDNVAVPIWTYTSAPGSAATLGGPTIVANAGDTLHITLHNTLTVTTSLSIIGATMPADLIGVAPGGVKSYAITVSDPGTYAYEAGPLTDGERQVAMGLYGALIVRPAVATQAYASANSAFTNEALLVFSEIDPAFNAAPLTYNIGTLKPKYWLINGQAYPNTPNTSVSAGGTTLLRMINAGVMYHSIGLLGLNETVIAAGAKPLSLSYSAVSETIPAGDTLDTLVSIPASDPTDTKYAVYDAGMHVDNNGASFGGMLTFLNVAGATTPVDTAGPITSNVVVAPGAPNGTGAALLSATASDNSTGGSTVTAAEYFIDTVGASGGGTAMAGAFGSTSVNASATIPAAVVNALASGTHTIYVHAKDALGNWGAVSAAQLVIDTTGPTTGVVLTPSVINSGTIAIRANGDDTTTGGSNVIAAEYFIDTAGASGSGTTMGAASQAGATASFSVNIPAPAAGTHTIYARTRDALGNWGALGSTLLTVDQAGPNASAVTIAPCPQVVASPPCGNTAWNNGAFSANGGPGTQGGNMPSIRVDALLTDPLIGGVNSAIVNGEVFVGAVGANGTGYLMQPTDGTFSTPSESAYVFIPLGQIINLATGAHPIFVHGQDAAGNWGTTFAQGTLIIDKTAPTVNSASIAPTPSVGLSPVTLTLSASDTANGASAAAPIAAAEYYIDTDPGVGLATAIPIATPATPLNLTTSLNVAALAAGNHTVGVRVMDAAGNWSAVRTAAFTIDRLFANSFTSAFGSFGWSGTGGTAARLSLSNAAANLVDAGTRSLAVSISAGSSGYVVNNLPPAAPNNANVTSYRARFYINPNSANIGTSTPTIFAAMSGAARTTTVFQVQLRRVGTQYSVRATGTSASTAWVNITGSTAIEVARVGTTLTLYVGNVAQGTVTVATSNLTAARLGLSAGIPAGINLGTIYFDGFVSTRTTPIGL